MAPCTKEPVIGFGRSRTITSIPALAEASRKYPSVAFVRIKVATDIVDIEHDRIQSLQDVNRGPALGFFGAVDAVNGNAGGCILGIRDCRWCPVSPVTPCSGLKIASSETPGLGRGRRWCGVPASQCQSGWSGVRFSFLPVEALSTSKLWASSTSIPVCTTPLRVARRRAAVWASLYPVMLFQRSSSFSETVSGRAAGHRGGHLERKATAASLPPGMDGVGQQNNVGLRRRIDHRDVPVNPVCPNDPTGRRSPRLLENGEIDVPAESRAGPARLGAAAAWSSSQPYLRPGSGCRLAGREQTLKDRRR